MLYFSIRGKTERMILRGKRAAVRDVYEALEFFKPADISVKESDNITIRQLSERSGTCRRKVYGVLEELENLGLIKIRKLSKRGLYQFRLVHYGDDYEEARRGANSEVVQLPGSKSTQRDAEYEASKAEFLTGLGD